MDTYLQVEIMSSTDGGRLGLMRKLVEMFGPCVGMKICASVWPGTREVEAIVVNADNVGTGEITNPDPAKVIQVVELEQHQVNGNDWDGLKASYVANGWMWMGL